MKSIFLLGGLIAAAALTGCAGPRTAMPAPYTVSITADTHINPDMEGRPTPVQVRLLELKRSHKFESLDFYTLYDKDEATLGAELLSKDQLTLQPGQKIKIIRKANVDARMLGVFVAFKDVTKGSWRAVTPLPPPKELGRFEIFNPSFKTTFVDIKVGPQTVTAHTTGMEVPVPIPGSGGLPQIHGPSVPSTPSGVSTPSVPFHIGS